MMEFSPVWEIFYYLEMNLCTICSEIECCMAWKRNDNMKHPEALPYGLKIVRH